MQGTPQELLSGRLVKGALSLPAPLSPGPFFPLICVGSYVLHPPSLR